MNNTVKEMWDSRYAQEEFAYGIEPNQYLKEQLEKLEVGSILFPAEGEGRNAVFAAKLGWNVSAFDISVEGKNKALRIAEANQVNIDYQVGELETLHYTSEQFDAMALIFAHFQPEKKSQIHQTLISYLRQGGIVIFEAFSKKHLEYVSKNEKVGGPKDINALFSLEKIRSDFKDFEIITLEEKEIELKEGIYHNGIGCVIRFVGRKK